MNNQNTNQTVLNSTSQDTKQPEAVAPVTDNQATQVTAPATDTDPAYDWISKKWYSKTNATDLSEIAQIVVRHLQ